MKEDRRNFGNSLLIMSFIVLGTGCSKAQLHQLWQAVAPPPAVPQLGDLERESGSGGSVYHLHENQFQLKDSIFISQHIACAAGGLSDSSGGNVVGNVQSRWYPRYDSVFGLANRAVE